MTLHPPSTESSCAGGADRQKPAPTWQAWLETLVISLVLIAVGAAVDRRDPFVLRRGFSWLTLAPLFAAIQYGSLHGLACGAFQAVLLGIAWRSGLTALPDSAAEIVLGWLFMGLVAGEFRDSWFRRVRHAESCADHLRIRLEELGRAYLTLKISHDRLRRDAPDSGGTLCDAVAAFRGELDGARGSAAISLFGSRILALFADHASVRAAALHPVGADGVPAPAVATMGPGGGAEHDPLVHKAARSALTVSLRDAGDGQVLVAVPLVDARGHTHAVVAIREMPFLALEEEMLELLAVLGGRLGDCFSQEPSEAESPRTVELRIADETPVGTARAIRARSEEPA
jgi:hypothetical protein